MPPFKDMLLSAPDSQLDQSMRELIMVWDDEPTSLQILEVLDKVIYSSLGSDFVVTMLQIFLETTMAKENTTLEKIVPGAHWRANI
ncbi:MAG: hypothetical protein M0R77_02800 [Gammaproteobacteria bacterium]|nr:hypothetical protein [Gammaproteobacteria bacterium]